MSAGAYKTQTSINGLVDRFRDHNPKLKIMGLDRKTKVCHGRDADSQHLVGWDSIWGLNISFALSILELSETSRDGMTLCISLCFDFSSVFSNDPISFDMNVTTESEQVSLNNSRWFVCWFQTSTFSAAMRETTVDCIFLFTADIWHKKWTIFYRWIYQKDPVLCRSSEKGGGRRAHREYEHGELALAWKPYAARLQDLIFHEISINHFSSGLCVKPHKQSWWCTTSFHYFILNVR